MENFSDKAEMADALPNLADAIRPVLASAQIQVLSTDLIDVQFDGLPAWKIHVTKQLLSNQMQLFVTYIDLTPMCLASQSLQDLQKLAAIENLGLRGVTVLPIDPATNESRGGLRVRASYVGQKGRTTDEVESLAVDIMNVLAFARILEDRVTLCAIAGDFSQELHSTLFGVTWDPFSTRIVSNGQSIFHGSSERVFSEITRSLQAELGFKVQSEQQKSASVIFSPSSSNQEPLEVFLRIPNEIPLFIAQAQLLKATTKPEKEIYEALDDLNLESESGHFEFNPVERTISYASWKHLTNDLRHYSFDHTVLIVNRARTLAVENFNFAPVQAGGGTLIQFPAVRSEKKAA